ncbi:MAG: hypothetical protein WCK02_07805 [Bacteroidota bacterium]
MKWNLDITEKRICGATNWKSFNELTELEDKSGVYIFANNQLHLKYIGVFKTKSSLLEINDALKKGLGFNASLVKVLYTNTKNEAIALHNNIIELYQPVNNK